MEHVGFPSDETFAAFLDGELDEQSRKRIIEHMAGCDECYALFTAAAEFRASETIAEQPPRQRRTRLPLRLRRSAALIATSAAVAASLVAVLVLHPPTHTFSHDDSVANDLAALAANSGHLRTSEARISGFPYQKHVVKRGGHSSPQSDPDSWGMGEPAKKIADREKRDPSAENLHALGVSHLAVGNWDDAVASLEQAVSKCAHVDGDPAAAIKRCNDSDFLSDLAAAYLARYEVSPETAAEDLHGAIAASERAWIEKRTPQAAWNRALARQAMHVREDAREAWQDYLTLDSASPWATEARDRLRVIRSPGAGASWKEGGQSELEKAAAARNLPVVERLVAAFPQQSREFAENQLLPRSANDPGALVAAETIGDVLRRRSGEALVSESVAALRSRSAVDGLASFARGVDAHKNGRDTAGPAFSAAAQELRTAGNPLSYQADFYVAIAAYGRRDRAETQRRLHRLATDIEGRSYLGLAGRINWILGICALESGHPYESLASYQMALESFSRGNEIDNMAAVNALIAQNYEVLGDTASSWTHFQKALDLVTSHPGSERLSYVLIESAMAAVQERREALGLLLTNRLIKVASTDAWRSDGYTWRAIHFRNLGQHERALADFGQAQLCANRIADASERERALANVKLSQGELLSEIDPAASIAGLNEALVFLVKSKDHFERAELFAARGHAHEKLGDRRSAADDYAVALREVEQQEERIDDVRLRTDFVQTSRQLYSQLVRLSADAGHWDEAFALVDRSRSKALLDEVVARDPAAGTLQGVTTKELAAALPAGISAIEYFCLDDRVLCWLVTTAGSEIVAIPVNRARVQSLVVDLGRPADAARYARASADLYRLLIQPLTSRLGSSSSIVFIPDAELSSVSFSELRDSRSGRYLIEDFDLASSPSASLLVRGLASDVLRTRSGIAKVLAFANPSFDRNAFPGLHDLAGADDEGQQIRGLFPHAVVAEGAAARSERFVTEAPGYDIVHFGGHAVVDPMNSDYSALLFSGNSSRNGVLYAHELRKLSLRRTRLVVLSGCSTASGDAHRSAGGGAISLTSAFVAAGVPVVLGTLWDIDDQAGRELVRLFYDRLAHGDTPSRALRTAKLAMLHGAWPDPRDWAAFELVGISNLHVKQT